MPQGRIADWFKKVWKKGKDHFKDNWRDMIPGIIDFGKNILMAEEPGQEIEHSLYSKVDLAMLFYKLKC